MFFAAIEIGDNWIYPWAKTIMMPKPEEFRRGMQPFDGNKVIKKPVRTKLDTAGVWWGVCIRPVVARPPDM